MMLPPSRAWNDRGETSIQAVLLVPVVFGIFFLGAHAASIAYGSHVATVAASRGAQMTAAVSSQGSEMVMALNEIEQVVRELGANMTTPPVIRIDSESVTVNVTLDIQRIVPFLPTQVSRTASVARERFVMEQNR
jgi:hypothetical protein